MRNEELFKGQSIPHDSATKHVSGFAKYTDDITEPFFSTIQPTDGLVPVHPKFTLACSNARDKKYEFLNFKLLLRLAI